ncbi:MAG TPA: hypothetical protein VGO93_10645 [Candidatus Xenobia bacterium]|jgi:hypothetical protein
MKLLMTIALGLSLGLGAWAQAEKPDTVTDVQPDGTLVTAQSGPIQLGTVTLPDGAKRQEAVDMIKRLVLNQSVVLVDKGTDDSHRYEVMFTMKGSKYPLGWTLISQHLASAAVGSSYAAAQRAQEIHDKSPVNKPPVSDTGTILRITGHCSVDGCDQVGLFQDGTASSPYKTGTVDANGDYVIEVDLTKDLHPFAPGYGIADLRFFKNGAFGECHGKCNFIVYNQGSNQVELQVYEGPKYPIKGRNFEYTEKD